MGIPKHGKESSRTKSSAKYKANGRRAINKARNIEKEQIKANKNKGV